MAKEIDYDFPVVLDTVFKEENGTEVKATLAVVWDDIISLQSYPFERRGHWVDNAGPKFYLTLREQGTQLCIGSFKDMLEYWKNFRKQYYGR